MKKKSNAKTRSDREGIIIAGTPYIVKTEKPNSLSAPGKSSYIVSSLYKLPEKGHKRKTKAVKRFHELEKKLYE